MKCFIILALFSASSVRSVTSEGCELPEPLRGQWIGTAPGWEDLTFTNTTVDSIHVKNMEQVFTCFLNNGSTYVLQSPEQHASSAVTYSYYVCLDIVPSDTSPYLVFFHIRTKKNRYANNEPFQPLMTTENKTLETICNIPSTELPLNYTYFLKKDYEAEMGNETCPSSLQAEFSVNFTDDVEQLKCPEGFNLTGCDLSHLVFNYTDCGGGDQGLGSTSGVLTYTCLASVKSGDVVYTVILQQETAGQQNQDSAYEYACVAQQNDDGLVTMIKSAGTCGGTPSVAMEAKEIVSCRPESTEAPTTPAGSEITTTQASNTSTPSTQGPGTGDGELGGGGCRASSWSVLSFLLPAIVLAAVKM